MIVKHLISIKKIADTILKYKGGNLDDSTFFMIIIWHTYLNWTTKEPIELPHKTVKENRKKII